MVSVVGPGSGRLVASVTCVARARRIEHQYHTVDDAGLRRNVDFLNFRPILI